MSDKILGPFTEVQRDAYIDFKTTEYLLIHPKAVRGKARKYARVKWRRKVEKIMNRGKHV